MEPIFLTAVGQLARASRSWTCSACRFRFVSCSSRCLQRGWSSKAAASPSLRAAGARSPRRRRVLLSSAGAAVAGATILAFTDDIKHGYEAAERSGRVLATLTVCVNDYRVTLNARAATDDQSEQNQLLHNCHKRCAERTLKVLEKNGGIFIKLGQHLSAMNYLLPSEWTSTFIPLQDRCPVSSFHSIEEMFRTDTGTELSHHFSDFSTIPIGAASLAQVHVATLRETGQAVAVKVQHPGLAQWAPLDLALTRYSFATLKWIFPEYDLEWLSSEMEASLPRELDFREEAANALRTQAYFARIPSLPVVIPDIIWAKRRILVMAYEAGRRPDDVDYLDANGIDRDDVSAALARIFNEMIFGRDAPLHCDPHGGNIAIRPSTSSSRHRLNFDVILYDHGLYRDIPVTIRRHYAKMWLAILDGDLDRMRRHSCDLAGITHDEFPLFASAITGRDFSALSAGAGSILRPRDAVREREAMEEALQDGLLANLVGLLGRVPRIILLILKTNDLTRSLDEGLHTQQPVRAFLILARYASRTVFEEEAEKIAARGSPLWPPNAVALLTAWLGFMRVGARLALFELWIGVERRLGRTSTMAVSSQQPLALAT